MVNFVPQTKLLNFFKSKEFVLFKCEPAVRAGEKHEVAQAVLPGLQTKIVTAPRGIRETSAEGHEK